MTRLAPRLALLLLTACGGPGDGDGDDSDANGDDQVTLTGALAKGPFVLGTSLTVAPTDDLGNPTGQVFQTQTEDDLGSFQLVFAWQGLVALEASGFYYNEVTGGLSAAPIDLRGLCRVSSPGAQRAFVNLITHLTSTRIKRLLQDGVDFDAAVAQAEGELRAAVGIPTGGLDTDVHGIDTNLLEGASANAGYLFALSSTLAEAAARKEGSLEANLQELLNTMSADLADDGAIAPALRERLDDGQAHVDAAAVKAAFAARLAALGSAAVVPDLDAFLDTDLDGFANALDLCVVVPDDQTDTDGDGLGDACDCGSGTVDPGEACDDGNGDVGDGCRPDCTEELCGDRTVDPQEACDDGNRVSGDGCREDCGKVERCGDHALDAGEDCDDGNHVDADGCEADCSAPACGNGIEDPEEVCFSDDVFGTSTGAWILVVDDLDGDDVPDVVSAGWGGVEVHLGQGDGTLVPHAAQTWTASRVVVALATGDLDGDGDADVVAVEAQDSQLLVFENDGTGRLAAPVAAPLGTGVSPSDLALGDVDEDGVLDAVVAELYGDAFVLLAGDGAGGFTPPVVLPTGSLVVDQPTNVRLAHIDHDNHLDVVAITLTSAGTRALTLPGAGDGTFSDAVASVADGQSDALATGDLDGDHDLDVVGTKGGFYALQRGLGDGRGAFDMAEVALDDGTVRCQPYEVQLGDVDGDGALDAVAGCSGGAGDAGVGVYLGDGDGGFATRLTLVPSGGGTNSVAIVDMDGDGWTDLVFVDGGQIRVARGHDW